MLFVTGATGHTGVRVVRMLLSGTEEEIRCIVRSRERAGRLPTDSRVRIFDGNLEDRNSYKESVQGAKAVIHIAPMRYAGDICQICREAGIRRIIILSSTRKFTRFPDAVSADIIKGEEKIKQMGLDWTVLRPTMIYGGAEDKNVEKLVSWVRRHKFIPLVGGGGNLVQPIFVGDLALAIVSCLDNRRTFGKIYDIAGPKALTYREMLEEIGISLNRRIIFLSVPMWMGISGARILKLIGMDKFVREDQVRRLVEDKCFDIESARRDFSFNPRSFAEGLAEKMKGRV